MFNRIASLYKTLGKKTIIALAILFFFSIITSLFEIIGIGFLAIFAVSLSDSSIIIDKIPFDIIKIYLADLEYFKLMLIFSASIFISFLLKHLISF